MKVTVGTDIIEVKRIQDAIENNKLRETVFISKYLDNKYDISWKNVEILNDENGRPYVNLIDVDGKRTKEGFDITSANIDVSISHIKEYAMASVTFTV